jgi:glycosyltransferase involved in cell wall biosynthesis
MDGSTRSRERGCDMRLALNAWFWDQPTVGSGQYLRHLAGHLPLAAPTYAYYLVGPADALPHPGPQAQGTTLTWHPASPLFGKERPRLRKLAFEQLVFPRACRALKADVAHVPHWGPPLFSPCPLVVTIHDLIPLLLPAYRSKWTMRWYVRLVGLAARRAAAVIAVSRATAQDVARHLHIPPERIRVIYEAAPPDCRPVADPAVLAIVRRKYALPDRFFLYIGGFDVRKNLETLLAAYAALPRTEAFPALVVAGRLPETDSPFMPDPRAQAARLGLADRVHFAGAIDEADKPALYSLAMALFYPSRYEGFGLPPLEAMACGCPVAASDATSLPEVVGEGGILVGPEDEGGWAEAMRRLADEAERKRWQERGLAQAARFSWLCAAQETVEVYARVAGRRL